MPKTSKGSASETVEVEGYEGHLENLVGGYTVAFEKYTADADLAEFFKGLPDDRCQSPHWGYVLSGKVTFKSAAGEETFETGDAYYVPPGHTPVLYAGTEVVEFSPTEQLEHTLAVVTKMLRQHGARVRLQRPKRLLLAVRLRPAAVRATDGASGLGLIARAAEHCPLVAGACEGPHCGEGAGRTMSPPADSTLDARR
jgi:hypothetical protein